MDKIFDLMLSDTIRNNFVRKFSGRHYYDTEELEPTKQYILSDEYVEDVNKLKRGEYYFPLPELRRIQKHDSKRYRKIYLFPDKTKFLLKIMVFALNSLDSMYSDSLYSFRRNKSHRYFFKKINEIDPERKYYVVKTDVHAYAESIDQDILLKVLKKIFKDDPEYYNFMEWLLKRNQYIFNGKVVSEKFALTCGLPLGSFFYNIYLMHIDTYLETHYDLYMRYSDDIAIFCKTEKDAIEARKYLDEQLAKVKLELNLSKTKTYVPGEPFEILGFEVTAHQVDVSKFSLMKTLKKIDYKELALVKMQRKENLPEEKIFKLAFDYYKHLFFGDERTPSAKSWTVWTFATITTDKSLKIIDRRMQRFFRVILTKKRSDSCYRIKYSELKKRGYYSLVNLYHHRDNLKLAKRKILGKYNPKENISK